jgi:hypothetical protein
VPSFNHSVGKQWRALAPCRRLSPFYSSCCKTVKKLTCNDSAISTRSISKRRKSFAALTDAVMVNTVARSCDARLERDGSVDPSLARVQSNYSIRFCTPQLYHSVTRLISLIQYEELSIEHAIINTGFIRIVLLPARLR